MKKFCVLTLLLAGWASAQQFQTGQAARVVIGQPTFTSEDPGASERLLGGVSGLAFANNMLFVADANRVFATPQNHRILMYRDIRTAFPGPLDELPVNFTRCQVCTGSKQIPYGVADLVLGQPDFVKTDIGRTSSAMRLPTAVATDGRRLVVADTENNRVLIWNEIPSRNNQPANLVLGAPDFTSIRAGVLDNKSFRGPQGVWIQGERLFVADTQNHRVMVWNSFPTRNDQPADYVLGQANFTTTSERELQQAPVPPSANRLKNPVSVMSDGTRLLVSDLGYNRVVIWNSIPTRTEQPADVVLGQPDMTSELANNVTKQCDPNGKDKDGKDTYPGRCSGTMSFPRYALSDGRRVYVADGGNDRVLIWNTIPTQNGVRADVVLGQPNDTADIVTDRSDFFTPNLQRGAPNTIRTPMSLAWDGTNLYVSAPYERRVLVFTPAEPSIPINGIRNAASRNVYAVGVMEFGGEVRENDEVTVKIADKEYKYKIVKDDKFVNVTQKFVDLINAGAGDPNVLARRNGNNFILLTARVAGEEGNNIDVTASVNPTDGKITITGGKPAGGGDATRLAPGTLVTILGTNLADQSASADMSTGLLPKELGGVQVYMDGIRVPLSFVSPTQINAQVPFDMYDTNGVSAYVRTRRNDGRITVTNALNLPIASQNPGIFADDGPDPRPAVVLHGSSFATGTVLVDGTAKENDVARVIVQDRQYSYTVKKDDTLEKIRDGLIDLVNNDGESLVTAAPAGQFTRIRLKAKIQGPEGNKIAISASNNDGASVVMNVTRPTLCCANQEGSRVTDDNPAEPGETLLVYATGLGIVQPDAAREIAETGRAYTGPAVNTAVESVSSLAGGKTANVLSAGLKPGMIGVYEVVLELNSDLPTNAKTQLTISQYIYTSNIVTFPLVKPEP